MISASSRTGKCVAIMKQYVSIMTNADMCLHSCYCVDMSTVWTCLLCGHILLVPSRTFIHYTDMYGWIYTPYEGPNLANHKSRKLGIFGRKLEEATPHFIIILINITENETIMFR